MIIINLSTIHKIYKLKEIITKIFYVLYKAKKIFSELCTDLLKKYLQRNKTSLKTMLETLKSHNVKCYYSFFIKLNFVKKLNFKKCLIF